MASDEERREVARKLRELDPDDPAWNGVHGFDFPLFAGTFFEAIWPNGGESGNWTERLADLIEPSPSCEFWDAGEQECYSVRTVKPVDRDALLALADEMEYDADVENAAKYDPMLGSIARMQVKYANRIREALGVES